MQEPINIYSKSENWLGRALTNPCYNSNYNIYPTFLHPVNQQKLKNPSEYLLPHIPLFYWAIHRFGKSATTKDAWHNSVEAWYFANTKNELGKDLFNQEQKEALMFHLIVCKFDSYPKLVKEIDSKGGIDWLSRCSHIVSGNKNWEGVGEKSNFIKVLCRAYREVKGIEQPREKKQTILPIL